MSDDKISSPPEIDASQVDSPFKNIVKQFDVSQQPAAKAGPTGTNSVQVDPGGRTFPTIAAALASITDNRLQKQYLLTLSPGTFNEQVTMKPYVYLQGAGIDQTTVTFPATADFYARGTIIGCSNSGIGNMTVSSLGGSWGSWTTALNIMGSSPFYADNVALISDDQGNAGINSETVSVNWSAAPQPASQVYISYSLVLSNMQSNQSVAVAMIVNGLGNTQLIESKVVARGGSQSFGAQSNGGGNVTLFNCYAEGGTFCLNIPDNSSTLIATNCQTKGPIGQGVQIFNNPITGGN